MAAGEGFEPSHTESESAVLPLHNTAIFILHANGNLSKFLNLCLFLADNMVYYTRYSENVNT